jgi:hypothetical protein
MGHEEVRAEEPRDKGDLMVRPDSDSTNDEAADERVLPLRPVPRGGLTPRLCTTATANVANGDWGEVPIAIAEGEREANPGVGAGAEQRDEPDTEHEDLLVEEEPDQIYSKKG